MTTVTVNAFAQAMRSVLTRQTWRCRFPIGTAVRAALSTPKTNGYTSEHGRGIAVGRECAPMSDLILRS